MIRNSETSPGRTKDIDQLETVCSAHAKLGGLRKQVLSLWLSH